MLRRSVSRLAPRVLVAVAEAAECGAASSLRRAAPSAAASACRQAGAAVEGLRQFRSSAIGCSSLAQTLKSEVDYEQQNYSSPEELAGGPPGGFKLEETAGDTQLSLTKIFKDEEISVDLMVNNQPEQEPYENDEGELEVDVGVVFNVAVTKGDKSLVFECKSDGSYLVIQHVSLEPAEGELPESYYTGPVYGELDEQVQTDFSEFLAERGVTDELGTYLLQLMHDKEQREYMAWLQKVHAFVAK